ncbi:uncharacterized protein C2845_PM15G06930 [Panicum miliaceum]|uniref:Uncharacterized protein n=1 Tax=Panicum miliaceum TaxID=4540 RepID=A0A3L6Q395_PANMI|nr:uncharacterized protein C2845_PM15G06930 [Panicum miliaceum]
MAPPSLMQPGSPAAVTHLDSLALVCAIAVGGYTAAFKALLSAVGAAPTPPLRITMPTGAATAPAAAVDAPRTNQSLGSADPLHHTTTLTPPATLLPGALQTPDVEQLIYPISTPLPEAHNHKPEPSPRITRYMHAHKNMKEGMCGIFNIMTRNGVAHQAALNVMVDLYDGLHMWGFTEKNIKNMMTSTQRLESQNRVLKDGYVSESTSLHMFAKRMLDSLQHADHMDAGETYYAQAEVVRACKAKFDEQLSRVYTRAVCQEYKKQYNNTTSFLIEPNPDPRVKNGWLVRHENGEGSFCWARHEFKVVANKAAGEYSCECKQWGYTEKYAIATLWAVNCMFYAILIATFLTCARLFCMHIIRVFTHLQVRKIPQKYILKRYTRSAREEVAWDRHDDVRIGAQASKEQTWMSKLLPKLMRLGRVGSRSDRAFEEIDMQLDKITPGIEIFPSSADGESSDPAASATGSVTTEGASSALQNEMLLIEPPVSRTKGRSPWKQKKNGVEPPLAGNPLNTYTRQNYGDRECSTCGVRGTQYNTTCPINLDRSKAAEKRATKRGANTQDGTPRKRGRPKIIRDLHEENDLNQDGVVATQASSSAAGGDARGGAAIGNRGRRSARVNYQK